MRDRIVVGIRSSSLSEKLQLDAELTLARAVTQVRQAEAVKLQQPLVRLKPDTPVGAVWSGRGGPSQTNSGISEEVGHDHVIIIARAIPPFRTYG